MTAFTVYELFIALVVGAFIGVVIVSWTNLQLRRSNAGALQAIQQGMGPLHNVCLFIVGGLPVACMWLLGTLRTAPTTLDTFAMIIMIGVAMVAALTLHGNMTKLLSDRMSAMQSR
jgi:hypothetical protein